MNYAMFFEELCEWSSPEFWLRVVYDEMIRDPNDEMYAEAREMLVEWRKTHPAE